MKIFQPGGGAGGTISSISAGDGITLTPDPIVSTGTVALTSPVLVTLGGTGTTTQFTSGSVVFAGTSGVYTQDNTNFFWDDTNNRLGLGVNSSLQGRLHIIDTSAPLRIGYDASAYSDFSVDASGNFYMNPTGGSVQVTNKLNINGATQAGRGLRLVSSGNEVGNIYYNSSYGMMIKSPAGGTQVTNIELTTTSTQARGFHVRNDANTSYFFVGGDGNVGINNTTPNTKLDILGTTQTGSSAIGTLNLAQTWNTTGAPTAVKLNVTDTASNASSLLFDFQKGGVSQLKLTKSGGMTGVADWYTIGGLQGNSYVATGASGALIIAGRGRIQTPTDGVFTIMNYGSTSLGRIQLGGTTSSFPAIKRNGTGIDIRLADDSDYAPVQAKTYSVNGTAGFTGTGAYTNFTIEGGIITAAS